MRARRLFQPNLNPTVHTAAPFNLITRHRKRLTKAVGQQLNTTNPILCNRLLDRIAHNIRTAFRKRSVGACWPQPIAKSQKMQRPPIEDTPLQSSRQQLNVRA